MGIVQDTARRANEIRNRLKSPPNAVIDRPINLRENIHLEPVQPKKTVPPAETTHVVQPIYQVPSTPSSVTIPVIILAVADYFLISRKDLVGRWHSPVAAIPRQVVYYLTKKLLPQMSFNRMGQKFLRDHTTIIHGFYHIQDLILVDKYLANSVREIEEMLRAGHYD